MKHFDAIIIGTGQVTSVLVNEGFQVFGVDAAPSFVAAF
jgi:hypothetical protein